MNENGGMFENSQYGLFMYHSWIEYRSMIYMYYGWIEFNDLLQEENWDMRVIWLDSVSFLTYSSMRAPPEATHSPFWRLEEDWTSICAPLLEPPRKLSRRKLNKYFIVHHYK